jgi:UDP-N-acetylmuramoyl-L-alanyl-D-glutamate--2,6-diaminopimelate ligase
MELVLHTLADYEKLLSEAGIVVSSEIEDGNTEVSHISYNSQAVTPGTLFVCKGLHFSVNYLQDALKAGAIAYIAEKKYDEVEGVPHIIVNDMRLALALIANFYYDDVWKSLKAVGITGTKGKSTTTHFMKFILDAYEQEQGSGVRSAYLTGIHNYDGVLDEKSHLTTAETFDLHEHFFNAVSSNINYLTMEVSSQALKYHRTYGVGFEVGCFLNIGQDHISAHEHKDFADYFGSKLKLFDQCKIACVNLDSDHADEVLAAAKRGKHVERVVTFSEREEADVYAYDIVPSNGGIDFKVKTADFDESFRIEIPGLFNVANALAAVAISYALGVSVSAIRTGLETAHVSGRMEKVVKDGKIAIVDYAHNKLSFETLFKAMKKEFPDRKLYVVFGCPGGKAYDRRREMGDLAGEYCDRVYLTEDDAGEEEILDICQEIEKYVRMHDCVEEIILDRTEAIRKAVADMDDKTVLIIAGKGHETDQKRGTKYVPMKSDYDTVKEILGV